MKRLHASYEKQSGAVLAIALMLLLVITVVGLSTFQVTGLEEKMAANSQYKNFAFQASETAIEEALDDTRFLSSAYAADKQGASWPTIAVTTPGSELSVSAEAQFKETTKNVVEEGSATSVTIGGAGWTFYNYEIHGKAEVTNTGSKNTNVQGAYLKAPSADTTI